MRIVPLAHHAHLAPILARWHHDEWHALYADWTDETALAELKSHTDPDRLPTTLVALSDDEKLLGSVSLVLDDLPGYEHLSPWLASLFVRPEYRGRGIGAALADTAVREAERLGVRRLYLFTPHHEAYYAGRGWLVFERTSLSGEPVAIMTRG